MVNTTTVLRYNIFRKTHAVVTGMKINSACDGIQLYNTLNNFLLLSAIFLNHNYCKLSCVCIFTNLLINSMYLTHALK